MSGRLGDVVVYTGAILSAACFGLQLCMELLQGRTGKRPMHSTGWCSTCLNLQYRSQAPSVHTSAASPPNQLQPAGQNPQPIPQWLLAPSTRCRASLGARPPVCPAVLRPSFTSSQLASGSQGVSTLSDGTSSDADTQQQSQVPKSGTPQLRGVRGALT